MQIQAVTKEQAILETKLATDLTNLFIDSFNEAYKEIPLSVLKVSSVEAFLTNTFEYEWNNFIDNKKVFCHIVLYHNNPIGIVFFELVNNTTIYVRQMCVKTEFQRQGIGTNLMNSIITAIPNIEKFSIATRKTNIAAYNFFTKLGFKLCDYTPNKLNPEVYSGWEKIITHQNK